MIARAGSHRFPRSARLRDGRIIRAILAGGARAAGERLLVASAPNGLPHPRLASVVGRKFSRRAVVRNRIRRLIREAFRLRSAELAPGWDYVIIPLRRPGPWMLARLEGDLVHTSARAVRSALREGRTSAPANRRRK